MKRSFACKLLKIFLKHQGLKFITSLILGGRCCFSWSLPVLVMNRFSFLWSFLDLITNRFKISSTCWQPWGSGAHIHPTPTRSIVLKWPGYPHHPRWAPKLQCQCNLNWLLMSFCFLFYEHRTYWVLDYGKDNLKCVVYNGFYIIYNLEEQPMDGGGRRWNKGEKKSIIREKSSHQG